MYPGGISSSNWRWSSGTIYGNVHINSAAYYAAFNTDFTPGGYSKRTALTLETDRFKCYGSAATSCKF